MLPDFVNPAEPIRSSWANDVVSSIRSITGRGNKKYNYYVTPTDVCPFGELVTIPHEAAASTRGIKGGLIACGDKNFNVADYDLGDAMADGNYVAYITITCVANMDDDSELILSGISTGTLGGWTVTTGGYPSNTNPTVGSSGSGTFIFPVGSLTVAGGKPVSFSATGCGSCFVNQCAGTLSYSRS